MSSGGRFNVPPFRHGHQHSRPSHRHDHRQPFLPRPPPTIEEKQRIAEAICADVQDSTNANIPLILAREKESCESDEEYWSDPEDDRCLAMIPINMQSKANRQKTFLHALPSCNNLDTFFAYAGYRGRCFCLMSPSLKEWRAIHEIDYVLEENNRCGRVFHSPEALLSHLASKGREDQYHHDAQKYIRHAYIR